MSEICLLCPINVYFINSYFLPFFSPISLRIFLLTNSCKSLYKVFSDTFCINFLKLDKFMFPRSFIYLTASSCLLFRPSFRSILSA